MDTPPGSPSPSGDDRAYSREVLLECRLTYGRGPVPSELDRLWMQRRSCARIQRERLGSKLRAKSNPASPPEDEPGRSRRVRALSMDLRWLAVGGGGRGLRQVVLPGQDQPPGDGAPGGDGDASGWPPSQPFPPEGAPPAGDAAAAAEGPGPQLAAEAVVAAMRSWENWAGLQETACRALRRIAAEGPAGRAGVQHAGGADALVRAMQLHPQSASLQANAARALAEVAKGGQHRAAVVESGALEMLASAMREQLDDLWQCKAALIAKELAARTDGTTQKHCARFLAALRPASAEE